MRITVIASDASHLVHAGGELERVTRTFDAPQEMADFIESFRAGNTYASVSLAIEADQQPTPEQRAAPEDVRRDAERLEWLMRMVSGKELRDIGVDTYENCTREAIDAAP